MNEAPNQVHPAQLPSAPGWPLHPAMVTSDLALPGFQIARSHGIVRGLTVGSAIAGGPGGAFTAMGQALSSSGVQNLIGKLVEVSERAHGEALFLVLQRAAQLGANGIIGFRYNTIQQNAWVTVLAYGTAVFAEPQEEQQRQA